MPSVLRWSPGAIQAINAIRGRASYARLVAVRDAISAIVADTEPGRSLLASVLRDETVWPNMIAQVTGALSTYSDPTGPAIRVDRFVSFIEEVARNDNAHAVGERHIAAGLASAHPDVLRQMQMDANLVFARTHELELGPEFGEQHISGRWHGLIDTSIVIECKDIWALDWRAESGSKNVTVWASIALLDEVDDQAYYHRSERVQRRAIVFAGWFRQHFLAILSTEGFEMREGVRFRVWEPPSALGPPDGQHLFTAELLADKHVPIRLLTVDATMMTRGRLRGLEVMSLSDDAFPKESQRRSASPPPL